MTRLYVVRAEWDAEACVWVAMSEDVPGLVTEAQTIETLDAKLMVMVPELLKANGVTVDGPNSFELVAWRLSEF